MKNCVIWTRVSTKRQEDNGGSLNNQKTSCENFAREHGYTIKGYFGGTHESAKTPGVLLREMYSAIKRDKSITHILVKSIDRFSRNVAQASTIIDELLKKNVIIVEADSTLDTSTREGVMMIKFKLTLAEWDNGNRTDKFISGRKHCLESGIYCGAAKALGYDKHGKSMNTTFTINDKGKLLQKAFRWKLQGLANCEIIRKLATFGLVLSKQKLHHILTNPFYAGKIRHKMLDGKIVDGNQPCIVSYADFLRIQEILSGRTGVYKHKKETPRFPLKRHVLCAHDHCPLTAYTVKKKNIDYYKCNKTGCKTNVSAKKMHSKYAALLSQFNIPKPLRPLLHVIIGKMITVDEDESKQAEIVLKKRRTELQNKLKNCKVKYGMGDIDEEIYILTNKNIQEQLDKIELELKKCRENLSNQEKDIDNILAIACKLDDLWQNSSLELSQKVQNLVFPHGILWDKEIDDYRTFDENEALSVIARISATCKIKKEGISNEILSSVKACA